MAPTSLIGQEIEWHACHPMVSVRPSGILNQWTKAVTCSMFHVVQ
jgi:hypothetical protein